MAKQHNPKHNVGVNLIDNAAGTPFSGYGRGLFRLLSLCQLQW